MRLDLRLAPSATRRAVLAALIASGCATSTGSPPPRGESQTESVPAEAGLAFGRVTVEGWRRALVEDSRTSVEFRSRRTGQRFTAELKEDGEVFAFLPAGPYVVTRVQSGFQGVERLESVRFLVPAGSAIYLGTVSIRMPTTDRKGDIAVLDDFDTAARRLKSSHPALAFAERPIKGLMFAVPSRSGIYVSAILNDKVAVPMLVDTGATYTVLTKKTATDLGITDTDTLPTLEFHSVGHASRLPVTRLRSVRVGTVDLADVDVAIESTGRLTVGLLGMSFLRHFRVTVEGDQDNVRFDR